MPQRPRPRNYRKRQQDSDDEEQVSVAEEGGVKEEKESEEDSVRCVLFVIGYTIYSKLLLYDISRLKLEEAKELQKFRKKPAGVRYYHYNITYLDWFTSFMVHVFFFFFFFLSSVWNTVQLDLHLERNSQKMRN